MSAFCRFCLHFSVVFCISVSTTLCSKVEWRNPGASITIKCECKGKPEDIVLFKVMKGLKKDHDFFFTTPSSSDPNFAYEERTQYHGNFPSFQVILKNLTTNDTGVYWCMYKKDEPVECEGSVLLVVKDTVHGADKSTSSTQSCDPDESNKNLVVTFVAISSAMLFIFIIALLLFAKVKCSHAENKPRSIPHNDVYEDMRGTIRR